MAALQPPTLGHVDGAPAPGAEGGTTEIEVAGITSGTWQQAASGGPAGSATTTSTLFIVFWSVISVVALGLLGYPAMRTVRRARNEPNVHAPRAPGRAESRRLSSIQKAFASER